MIDDLAAWLDTQGYCKMLWLEWNHWRLDFWKKEIGK
jgi:hypothetical protein